MAFNHSVKSFYSLHDAVNYVEENDSPSCKNFVDIVKILPPINELNDEILDDEN